MRRNTDLLAVRSTDIVADFVLKCNIAIINEQLAMNNYQLAMLKEVMCNW